MIFSKESLIKTAKTDGERFAVSSRRFIQSFLSKRIVKSAAV